MKEYIFDDIAIGTKESFEVTITKEMHDTFTKLSGDINPMHTDAAFAKDAGYKDCLVYGMLTASFYSTLVGVYLPGKYCLFHECDTMFNNPVYVGDILKVEGSVIEKNEVPIKRIIIKAIIRNQDNKIVSRAKLGIGVSK